jgi:hypothetical protein
MIEELGDGVVEKGTEGEGSGRVEGGGAPTWQLHKVQGCAQCAGGGGRELLDRGAKGADAWSPRPQCRFKPSQTANRAK